MSDYNHLVFLDTETTGLELTHDIWEIAYAFGTGPIFSEFIPHSLRNADPVALNLNGYYTRFRPAQLAQFLDSTLREDFAGKTLVGANVSFDAIRLELRWGAHPWHYRMIDVESMALGIFKDPRPVGLATLVDRLRATGYTIPESNHTAREDVAAVRAVYFALEDLRDKKGAL